MSQAPALLESAHDDCLDELLDKHVLEELDYHFARTMAALVDEVTPPEVLLGQAKPSARSDLFSLAVLLFRLLTRHDPFRGQRELAAARTIDGTAVPRGRPVVIERVVGQTLYVRPRE